MAATIAALVLTAAPLGALPSDASLEPNDLGSALLEVRRDPARVAQTAGELAAEGVGIVPVVLAVRIDGHASVQLETGATSRWRLSPPELETLERALSGLGWSDLRGGLAELIEASPSEPMRAEVLDVVAEHAPAADLLLIAEWSVDDPAARVPRARVATFETSLARFLERHRNALDDLPRLADDVHLSLVPSLVERAAAEHTTDGLVLLSRFLGRVPDADPLVLTELRRLALHLRFRGIPDEARGAVRGLLDDPDPARLALAIDTAAALEDREAVPTLIEHLQHESANVRGRALEALRTITFERDLALHEDWEFWYANTERWWRDEAPERMSQVVDAKPAFAARAAKEISQRRLYREEFLDCLTKGSRRPETDIAVLCCATLGHIGVNEAAEPLKEALRDKRLEVRKAAYQALRRMTGENHGEDPEMWDAAGW